MNGSVIAVKDLHFSYNSHRALSGVSLNIGKPAIFGLLGPNGSGKTTLFRILSTLLKPDQGTVQISGLDLASDYRLIRKKIGIVFQSPSLDPKLTVCENISYQGYLYGMSGTRLRERTADMMKRLGVLDRAKEKVAKLSGGLKRRVELAKGLLHKPEILLLDEPSTGLDPGARLDLWNYLSALSNEEGLTIVVTTHLMEEAELCGRLAILNHGKIVGEGTPENLKSEVGGDVIVFQSRQVERLSQKIAEKFKLHGIIVEGNLQIEHEKGARLAMQIVEAFPGEIDSVTYRRPTLEDVFVHKTGYQFFAGKEADVREK